MTQFYSLPEDFHRAGMTFINDLLEPAPLYQETGITRLSSGALVVSVRTDMLGCKGQMLEWWFKFFETTQHLSWWHPLDHKAHHGWDEHWKKGKNYIGATIRAVESLGSIPAIPAVIKFHHPQEVFDKQLLETAIAQKNVAATVYARIGFGENTPLDASGDPLDGQMIHVVRDTSNGAVLRSRFILGLNASDPVNDVPNTLGLGLLQHCYSEFSYLSKILPSLYYGDPVNRDQVPLMW